MKDTIIKGTGNSRTLHFSVTAVAEYQTLADFLAAGASEAGIPIDIGPLNPEGVVQMGTPLNKQALLKDSTSEIIGLPANSTPDDALFSLSYRTVNNASVTYISVKYADGTPATGVKISGATGIEDLIYLRIKTEMRLL